jgi:putative transposase
MKCLFEQSRQSLRRREMMKKLGEEGSNIGGYKVRKLIGKIGLKVKLRVAYKVTTTRNHSDAVTVNLLN